MSKIGIIILATNAYFVLGIRFIKKFIKHYSGKSEIKFFLFSDVDPYEYVNKNIDIKFIYTNHKDWVSATNDKFQSILSLENEDIDYIYYFDSDTNINKNFTEDWFLGDLVGGEHYGNRDWLANGAGYDKNPLSKAYVNPNSDLPKTYYYGAFFGGKKERVISFCKTLKNWQLADKKINYEPGVNDESYINAYFHYNPPKVIKIEDFNFIVSDKGGLTETRNPNLDVDYLKNQMKINKDYFFDIIDKNIICV